METRKAVRTVVSMIGARKFRKYKPSAFLAGKNIVAGVLFEVAFLVLFTFIFAIHK